MGQALKRFSHLCGSRGTLLGQLLGIIEAHGESVSVKSKVNAGTTFSFHLPIDEH